MREQASDGGPTRRDYLKYGGAVVGGTAIAGCTSQSDATSTDSNADGDADGDATATDAQSTSTESETTNDDGSYSVEMFRVGEVEFESVPETVTSYNMGWADMVVSLGQAEKLQTNRLSAPTLFYDRFDVDWDNDYPALWQDGGMPKEVFYERDPDVIVVHWGITTGSVTWGGDGAFDTAKFREDLVKPMQEHEVGSQLTAVQNDRVLPGPTAEQGPLVNAFQTELTARLFYPEEFGELDMEAPLDVPEADQLFDRQRVEDILDGNV